MKNPLRVTPNVQIVEPASGLLTRDGFNLFQGILDQLTALQTLSPYTAANIADIVNAVNTSDKSQGLRVLDTTNNREMIARGSGPADPWDVADGSASVTPA
jgi:hypothetical protein